jgi:hypothetical protein
MLSFEQKAALEKTSNTLVAVLLANMPGGGPDAPVSGLQCTKPPRKADVEDWLAKKVEEDRRQQGWTLRWAAIAAIAAIAAAALGLISVLISLSWGE